MVAWLKQRVLILVRTYPVPAKSGAEVSCTAGITDKGKWIRLFPVPYRFLEPDQRFRKYQWIDVETLKAPHDSRPESYKLRADSIVIRGSVPPTDDWRSRRELLRTHFGVTFCGLQRLRDFGGSPTLGIVKPAKIVRLTIEPVDPQWTAEQLTVLQQQDLFAKSPSQPLEKLPYAFKYEFTCEDIGCQGHVCTCTDWEMGQSFRRWSREYGSGWEAAFRNRYEAEMQSKFDTYFYVGNLRQFPNAWIVIGLFYPPKPAMNDLFG